MNPDLAVYTLTYGRLDYTKWMMEGLARTAKSPYDHYIVDNGSQDGTVSWLRKYQPFHLICNQRNLGISAACNQALDAIAASKRPYRFILKVDNDCDFVDPRWLSALLDVLRERPGVYSPFVRGLRENKGGVSRTGYEQVAGHRVGWTRSLGGICTIAPASAYTSFRFPEDRPYIWGAMGAFVAATGLPSGYVEDAFVEHMETTEGQERRYRAYFKQRERERIEHP